MFPLYPIEGKAETFDFSNLSLLTRSIVLVIPMIHLSCMSTLPVQDLYFKSTQWLTNSPQSTLYITAASSFHGLSLNGDSDLVVVPERDVNSSRPWSTATPSA